MKAVVWIVVLFAAAVGIVLTSGVYTGNVYIVVGQVMMRVNLHAFVLGLVLFVVALYFLIKFIVGLMNIPTRMQRFGTARKGRQAAVALNSAGLAFFEGRFEKAEQEASKVLENKEAGDNRNLALMLGAHAADQMENFELRDHYLKDIEKLPNKQQLSRYLLLAESALGRRDYPTALETKNATTLLCPASPACNCVMPLTTAMQKMSASRMASGSEVVKLRAPVSALRAMMASSPGS